MRRMAEGRKLVMRPLMTGRFARVLNPGVVSSLLTCSVQHVQAITRLQDTVINILLVWLLQILQLVQLVRILYIKQWLSWVG